MAHVAFCIAPFTGHVNPSLAVVSELTRRGHRVSYATTAEFSARARAAGGHVAAYETTTLMPPGGRTVRRDPGHGDFARACRGQLRELEAVAPVLIAAFGDDVPDVVVCDPMNWVGLVLAARWQVPPINSVTSMISYVRWSLGPVATSFRLDDPVLPLLLAAVSAALARYRTGLTADQLLGAGSGTPVVAYYPRAFQSSGDQFGPHVRFVGPCLRYRPDAVSRGSAGHGRPWRPPGDGPVVLVSLGTVVNRQPELFRRCIDAFAELDCQVVAALGGLDATDLGSLPANVQAHTYLPLVQVMPYADVLVGHGGMTSTMEALSHGVPVAAMPQMPEQRINADRLAELGLGVCLEVAQQTEEALRASVAELMQDVNVGPRLDWMRAEIERAPGAPAAAEVIENATQGCHNGRQLA